MGQSLPSEERKAPLLLSLTSRWATEEKQLLGKGDASHTKALMCAGFVAGWVT
jgi:hypothetical protein